MITDGFAVFLDCLLKNSLFLFADPAQDAADKTEEALRTRYMTTDDPMGG